MSKSIKLILLMGISFICLCGCSLLMPDNSTPTLTKGQTVPDVTLVTQDGKEVTLKDYAGKKIYINVWASWCGPCKREFPELEKAYQDYKNKEDYAFLSVVSSKDKAFNNARPADASQEEILRTAKEGKITYPILFDKNDSFMSQFGIRSFPTHIIINSDGTLEQFLLGGTTKETLTKLLQEAK